MNFNICEWLYSFRNEYGKFYVAIFDRSYTRFLYPDGTLQNSCVNRPDYHGWYQTRQEAQDSIDRYLEIKKEESVDLLLGKIKLVLEDFIIRKQMFTAQDITDRFKITHGFEVSHEDVKQYVHGEYLANRLKRSDDKYTRRLIPVAIPNPWLYYIYGFHKTEDYTKKRDTVPAPEPKTEVLTATFTGFHYHDS